MSRCKKAYNFADTEENYLTPDEEFEAQCTKR
jgi:hypothetical protein